MSDELITVAEASARFGVPASTLYVWLHSGVLTRYKRERGQVKMMVSVQECERLLTFKSMERGA